MHRQQINLLSLLTAPRHASVLLLQNESLRCLPNEVSGSLPQEAEFADFAACCQAAGQGPWTVGQVASLRWQHRLATNWAKRLLRCGCDAPLVLLLCDMA